MSHAASRNGAEWQCCPGCRFAPSGLQIPETGEGHDQKGYRAEKYRAGHDDDQQPTEVNQVKVKHSGASAMNAKVGQGPFPARARIGLRQPLVALKALNIPAGNRIPFYGQKTDPRRPQAYGSNKSPD